MKKLFFVIVAILLSVFTTSQSFAQNTDVLPDIPDVKLNISGKISPISQGQSAPFTGVLFDVRAASWVLELPENYTKQSLIDIQYAVDKEKAVCTKELSDQDAHAVANAKISQAIIDEQNKRIELYTKQIQQDAKASSPCIWCFVGGSVLVGAVVSSFVTYEVMKK